MADRAVVMQKPVLCQVGSIVIDVCKDETHDLSNTVTDHPVEQGFNASDHSRPDPDLVTLSCFVSNTPLSSEQQERANNETGSQAAELNPDGSTKITQVPGRAVEVFNRLKKLRDEGTLIAVLTTLKLYGVKSTEGMMIQRLSISRTSKNFDGLEWTMTLKQVRVVKNRHTRQRVSKDPRPGKKVKDGNKTTKPEEVETSRLQNGYDKQQEAKEKGEGSFGQGTAFMSGVAGF